MVQIQPQINIPAIARRVNAGRLRIGRAPVWDWELGDFVLTPDYQVVVSDTISVEQVVRASLATERGQYAIYDFNFGSDFHKVIGGDPAYAQARIPNMVVEAITDPRVVDVNVEEFTIEDEVAFITFGVRDAFSTNTTFDRLAV